MNYKKLKNKILKNKITLKELHDYTDMDRFIEEYQHCINNNEEDIIELFDALVNIGFYFKPGHFSHHLEHGLYNKVTEWYLEQDEKFRDNNFLLDAMYGIEGDECYGYPLRCLLSNGFNPNLVESMDHFWYYQESIGNSRELLFEHYELLLEYGYIFSNPLVVCDILTFFSFIIKEEPLQSIYIDPKKFMDFPEIKKYMEMDYIEIKEEHVQQIVEYGYKENREAVIEEVINGLKFQKKNL